MTLFDINKATFPWKERRAGYSEENNNIDLSKITTVYITNKEETGRSNFVGTFSLFSDINQYSPTRGERYESDGTKTWNTDAYWQDKPYDDAYDYWNAITDDENKNNIMKRFGLEEEEYDALACIALALGSQETGMGFEEGYQEESGKDTKVQKDRNFKINTLNWLDGREEGLDALSIISKIAGVVGIDIPEDAQSASSGLTQMKIHDIMNNPENFGLATALTELGITSESVTENNLAQEPDKAALATMAYLATLLKEHKSYEAAMEVYHETLTDKIKDEIGLSYSQALQEGYENVMSIFNSYNNAEDIETMKKIRDVAKNWVMSSNGSTLENIEGLSEEELLELADSPENKYNEEAQLILLNSYLPEDEQLDNNSLKYIRLFFSEEAMVMSPLEYIPHAWNTGAKLNESQQFDKYDRFFATQMSIILSDPETFQYDQFTPSVIELAKLYANQGSNDGYYAIEDTLDNYTDFDERYPNLPLD